jgi:hypothetical protein
METTQSITQSKKALPLPPLNKVKALISHG